MEIKEHFNLVKVPTEKVVSKPWNPKIRENYKKEFEMIKQSIVKDGIILPLNVREVAGGKYEIVDGEQRFAIYQELGIKELTVNNLGKLTDAEARAKTINIEASIPLDYLKTSQLMKEIIELEGEERALELLTVDMEELNARVELLDIPEYENIQVAFEDLDKNENGQRVYVKMEKSEYEAMISSVKAVRGKLDKREFADWLLAHE